MAMSRACRGAGPKSRTNASNGAVSGSVRPNPIEIIKVTHNTPQSRAGTHHGCCDLLSVVLAAAPPQVRQQRVFRRNTFSPRKQQYLTDGKMSLFFDVLPADLQIDILFAWIMHRDDGYDLLKVLAALDMACSQACRPPFLWLTSQLPPFGDLPSKNSTRGILHVVSFVHWLSSRRVALKALLIKDTDCDQFADEPAITLPAVERICWTGNALDCSHLLKGLLRCCPNLTSMDCEAFSSATIGPTFLTKHVPKLNEMVMNGSVFASPQSIWLPPQLQVLRLRQYPLDSYLQLGRRIASSCPLLKTLEALCQTDNVYSVLGILGACSRLRELTLLGSGLKGEGIARILAFGQIKRFSCQARTSHTSHGPQSEEVFANTLELRPDLEYLQVNCCHYFRPEGNLHIISLQCKADVMRRILNICTFVAELDVSVDSSFESATVITEHVGVRLKALAINCPREWAALMGVALQQCAGGLITLDLNGDGVDDQLLLVVGQHCPLLKSLFLSSSFSSTFTDDGMLAVISGCPHLQHCTVKARRITRNTLQAILDHRLRLMTLTLTVFSGATVTAAWFRQQCKEHMLLPVPIVHFYSNIFHGWQPTLMTNWPSPSDF